MMKLMDSSLPSWPRWRSRRRSHKPKQKSEGGEYDRRGNDYFFLSVFIPSSGNLHQLAGVVSSLVCSKVKTTMHCVLWRCWAIQEVRKKCAKLYPKGIDEKN